MFFQDVVQYTRESGYTVTGFIGGNGPLHFSLGSVRCCLPFASMPDRSRWGTSFSCCRQWSRVVAVTPRAQAQKTEGTC